MARNMTIESVAVPGSLLCWPDAIISSVSLEMHAWSRAKQEDYRAAFAEQAQGIPAVSATDATEAALKARDLGLV